MISRRTLFKLADEGLQLDMLGQPLAVGDTVLVKGYSSNILNQFATIKSVINGNDLDVKKEEELQSYKTYKEAEEENIRNRKHFHFQTKP